jgi:hypothetical protein
VDLISPKTVSGAIECLFNHYHYPRHGFISPTP